ncbi:MAG: peptidyl-prolyl cis-trans isomerase [Bacteroidetes bacterium]|nr:peptidyl-prolyl cis-trans isomerase [Bacteroidota bacterium]
MTSPQIKICLIATATLFMLSGCKNDVDDSAFVARVNDTVLTESMLASMMQSPNYDNKYSSEVIRQWVEKEILFQEAVNLEITENSNIEFILETSRKELAAAILLKEHYKFAEKDVDEEELIEYYNESKDELKLIDDAYLYNIICFNNEYSAIDYRRMVMTNGWADVKNLQSKDSTVTEFRVEYFQHEYQIYPSKILKIMENLLPGEVSIVLKLEPEKYTIVQLLNKFKKGSIPKYEYVKKIIENRYKMIRRKKIYSEYFQELSSKYNVEIKKGFE